VTCCTHFRYGQCHQEYAQLGAIVCRVVTCTPPWNFDSTCTGVDAQDDATRFHDAPCLHQPEKEPEMPPNPAIAVDSDGSQWVFVRGINAELWFRKDNQNWVSLGGGLTSGPAVTATADGKMIVVVRGNDSATWRIARDATGKWGSWTSLGGLS
jgi:hypothetical protein